MIYFLIKLPHCTEDYKSTNTTQFITVINNNIKLCNKKKRKKEKNHKQQKTPPPTKTKNSNQPTKQKQLHKYFILSYHP